MNASQDSDYIYLDSVDSTNIWCLQRVDELASGTIVVAGTQTGGRGRHGRRWFSPPGSNLYASIVLKAPFMRIGLGQFPQLGALAVYDTVRDAGVRGAWIKWPNDVWCERRKLAGVLCESKLAGGRLEAVVMGIGINVNMGLEQLETIDQPATSLAAVTGLEHDIEALARTLFRYVNHLYQLTEQHGFSHLHPRWREASRLLGQPVVLRHGAGQVQGVVENLLTDGGILLREPDGSARTWYCGDVSLRLLADRVYGSRQDS